VDEAAAVAFRVGDVIGGRRERDFAASAAKADSERSSGASVELQAFQLAPSAWQREQDKPLCVPCFSAEWALKLGVQVVGKKCMQLDKGDLCVGEQLLVCEGRRVPE
jgi:hypothetical protein